MSLGDKVGAAWIPGRPQWCLRDGAVGWGRLVALTPEHSRGSSCPQPTEAAFTAALPCRPLVFFHLCQGPQVVIEGILIMIIKSHHPLTVHYSSALVKMYCLLHFSQPHRVLEVRKQM